MTIEFRVPRLPHSAEVTVGRWLKQAGDSFAERDCLVEVHSEHLDWDLPSPCGGALVEIWAPVGARVRAGDVIAVIAKEPVGDTAAQIQPVPAPAGYPRVSPLVARMAAEHAVDMTQVRGTGPGGRVTKVDVLAYVEARDATPSLSRRVDKGARLTADTLVPLAPPLRALADLAARSKAHVPHVSSFIEVDMSHVVTHCEEQQARWSKREGFELVSTPYIVMAAVAALRAVPVVNAYFTTAGVLMKNTCDVGIRLGGEGRLRAPVIRHAEQFNLVGLARRIYELETRAMAGDWQSDDLPPATFTVCLGTVGLLFMALIVEPQVAVLTAGAVHLRAVVAGDAVQARPTMFAGLTYDHRVVDGIVAGQFLTEFKRRLETMPFR